VAGKIIGAESGGRAGARNPESSAGGLGQFTDGTWLAVIRRHRPDLAATRTEAELLQMKFDPKLSREMTIAHVRENRDALAAEGLPTDQGSLYLAHFLGLGGAEAALRASPDAPIGAVMSPEAMRANRNMRYGGRFLQDWTVGDLRRWAEVKMGQSVDPGGGYQVSTRAGYTTPDEIVTPTGTRIGVIYEIVDADTLIPASGRLQPRDRTRASSAEQIGELAARLDPARLMPSPEADRGAPIVGPDSVIESGNGRVQAILLAAERFPDRYDAYKAAIANVVPIPDGIARPVLVARRTSELTDVAREAFVREANTSAIARMSATEIAASDARAIGDDVLALYVPGRALTAAENRSFARALMEGLPQAERNVLFLPDGTPNADGVRRLRQALFARAYDAPDMTRLVAELEGGELRGILEALADVAPAWSRLRSEIAAGRISAELDATAQLLDAVRLIARAREAATAAGISVRSAIDDALAQIDMLTGAVDPVAAGFVEVFYRGARPRNAADVAELLTAYVDEAVNVGSTEARLFMDLETPNARDVLNAIRRRAGDTPGGGGGDGPGGGAGETVDDLIARGAAPAEITAHPDVQAAVAALDAVPRTDLADGYGTPEWWAERVYSSNGAELVGRDAAVDYLYDAARSLAWTDDGLPPPAERDPIRTTRRDPDRSAGFREIHRRKPLRPRPWCGDRGRRRGEEDHPRVRGRHRRQRGA
jgi:hypothetical protein